jgi:hypothetical protein
MAAFVRSVSAGTVFYLINLRKSIDEKQDK